MEFEQILSQVNFSAKKLLAGPEVISNEERKLEERKFMILRSAPNPIPLCQYVLENAAVPLVQFEAVSAMIDHMVRKWVLVTQSGLEELLAYFMRFLLSQTKIENYVREQLVLAVSVLIKRKLIDSIPELGVENDVDNSTHLGKPENSLLDQLCQRLESLLSDTQPYNCLVACSSVVSLMVEFGSLAHSSRFGLPWEIHLKCKDIFEKYYLMKFCIINLKFLQKLNENSFREENSRNSILSKSLTILNHVVTWNFTPNVSHQASVNLFKTGLQAIAFKPTHEWSDILLDGSMLGLLYRIHSETRNFESLCQLTLLCFIQLASLNGEVFADETAKVGYLKIFIENFLGFATQYQLTAQETAGFSGVISQMMSTFPIRLFAHIRQEVVESFLSGLAKLTIHCAENATVEDTVGTDGAPYLEAFELLLLAWVTLLSEMGEDIYAPGWFNLIGPELFDAFLKFRLTVLSGGSRPIQSPGESQEIDELEQDDRDIFVEHLSSIATIARTICPHAVPTACQLLEKCGNSILNCVASGGKVPVGLYEDFHWLILLTGHICVDITEGEEVQIPKEIRKYSNSLQKSVVPATFWTQLIDTQPSEAPIDFSNVDPIVRIISIMCKWAKVETILIKSGQILKLSPQVASDIMWFFLNWSQPYLFYKVSDYDETSEVWHNSFSSDGAQSGWLLNFLVEKAIANIHQWAGEDRIQSDSLEFLASLIRSPERHKVLTTDTMFWELVEQFGSGAEILKKLSPEVQLSLASFIGKSMAKENWEGLNEKVISQICNRISALTQCENVSNAILETDSLLSALSGIARMCPAARADTFLEVILTALNQITDCLKTPEVVSSLLSLLADICESCLTYFTEPVLFKMYNFSLKVIELFNTLNKTLSIQTNPHLEEDRYADLVQLMDILITLMSWDFMGDDDVISPTTKIQAEDVVFYGLDVVLHYMAGQFLAYPSLCNKFYNLLTLICETYPEKIANLPLGVFQTLSTLLELGLFRYDSDIGKYCLDAVSSLAIFAKQNPAKVTQQIATHLERLLGVIFNFLIDENFDMDLLSSAAETLFYLVLGNPGAYEVIIQKVLASQDRVFNDRLTQIFSHLNPELHPESPSKKSVLAFGNVLERELPKLRGILCIK